MLTGPNCCEYIAVRCVIQVFRRNLNITSVTGIEHLLTHVIFDICHF